ncbi:unnamed protein product [Phaeothamnion confervicola]
MDLPRVERTLQVFSSFAEAEESDRQYWWSQTAEARMAHLEELRRIAYGYDPATSRLQRFLEVVERPGR